MMKSKGVSQSWRVEEARDRWRKHVAAQRASGQTQVAYCRAQGLEPSYFSMWKRKLAASVAVAGSSASRSMRLVPLVVKPARESSECNVSRAETLSMHLTLRNGLSVSLRIPSLNSIPVLLNELAELAC
jgi:hypothetical protein